MQTNNQPNLPSINFEDYLSRISSDISFAKHLFHSPICTAKQTSNSFLEKQCLGYLTDAERSINIALDTIRAYNRIVQNLETQMSRDMLLMRQPKSRIPKILETMTPFPFSQTTQMNTMMRIVKRRLHKIAKHLHQASWNNGKK